MSSADVPEVASDPWPSVADVMPAAPVDHNWELAPSFLRRQPVRIVDGMVEGGYTSAFEVICYDCGGNPCLSYSEVSPGFSGSAGLTRPLMASQCMRSTWRGLPDGGGRVVHADASGSDHSY
jgi:hypothetical protein